MKKFLSLILILVMAITCVALTACDKETGSGNGDNAKITKYDGMYAQIVNGEVMDDEDAYLVIRNEVMYFEGVGIAIKFDNNKFSGAYEELGTEEGDINISISGEFTNDGLTLTIADFASQWVKVVDVEPGQPTNPDAPAVNDDPVTLADIKAALKKDVDSVNNKTTISKYSIITTGTLGGRNTNSTGSDTLYYNEEYVTVDDGGSDAFLIKEDGVNVFYEEDYMNNGVYENVVESENSYTTQDRVDYYAFANHNSYGISNKYFVSLRSIIGYVYTNLDALLADGTLAFEDEILSLAKDSWELNFVLGDITIDVELSDFNFDIATGTSNSYYFNMTEKMNNSVDDSNLTADVRATVRMSGYNTVEAVFPEKLEKYLTWAEPNAMFAEFAKNITIEEYGWDPDKTLNYQTKGGVSITDISTDEEVLNTTFDSKYQYDDYDHNYSFESVVDGSTVLVYQDSMSNTKLFVDGVEVEQTYGYDPDHNNNENPDGMYNSMLGNFGIGTYLPGAEFNTMVTVLSEAFLELAYDDYFVLSDDGAIKLNKSISSTDYKPELSEIRNYYVLNGFSLKQVGDTYVMSIDCNTMGLIQGWGMSKEFNIKITDMEVGNFNNASFEIVEES